MKSIIPRPLTLESFWLLFDGTQRSCTHSTVPAYRKEEKSKGQRSQRVLSSAHEQADWCDVVVLHAYEKVGKQ